MAGPFPMTVTYAEISVARGELTAAQTPDVKVLANQLMSRAKPPQTLQDGQLKLSQITGFELSDAALRYAEDYCPRADLSLDAYWNCVRGIPTQSPLMLFAKKFAKTPKDYSKLVCLAGIGEAVAGYVLEEPFRYPYELGCFPVCRPLFRTPDLLMSYRNNPGRVVLVEVKASESPRKSYEASATDALVDLIPLVTAWRNTGVAGDAVAVGVSVQVEPTSAQPTIGVKLVKLIDPEGKSIQGQGLSAGRLAMDALWGGDVGSAYGCRRT